MFPYVFLRYTVGAVIMEYSILFFAAIIILMLFFSKSVIKSLNKTFGRVQVKDHTGETANDIARALEYDLAFWNIDYEKLFLETFVFCKRNSSGYCDETLEPTLQSMLGHEGTTETLAKLMLNYFEIYKKDILKLRKDLNGHAKAIKVSHSKNPRKDIYTIEDNTMTESNREVLIKMYSLCKYTKGMDWVCFFPDYLCEEQLKFARRILVTAQIYDVIPDKMAVENRKRVDEQNRKELAGMLAYQRYLGKM